MFSIFNLSGRQKLGLGLNILSIPVYAAAFRTIVGVGSALYGGLASTLLGLGVSVLVGVAWTRALRLGGIAQTIACGFVIIAFATDGTRSEISLSRVRLSDFSGVWVGVVAILLFALLFAIAIVVLLGRRGQR